MAKIAFLFDVDGGPIQTHELQAIALHQSLEDALRAPSPDVKVVFRDEIIELLVGELKLRH